jgi:hypothetical protein
VGASGAALAVLRGVDLSGRLYDVMRLRGYTGRLAPTQSLRLRRADWRPLALAAWLALLGAGSRGLALGGWGWGAS